MTLPQLPSTRGSSNSTKVKVVLAVVFLLFTFMFARIRQRNVMNAVNASGDTKRQVQHTCKISNPKAIINKFEMPRGSKLSKFLEGPGLAQWPHDNTTRFAVCKFRRDEGGNYKHLPHAMQQLYRCFSWWRNNGNKIPVLLNAPTNFSAPYINGFMDLLQSAFHVQLKNQAKDEYHPVRPIVDYAFDAPALSGGYKMRSPGEFDLFRQVSVEYLGIHGEGCPAVGQTNSGLFPFPKITILNRSPRSGRHLLEIHRWKEVLESVHKKIHIRVVSSMDGLSFKDQVALMKHTDLLISPHGGQLTSIPFMPKCAAVLELFPVGYFTPRFFGSLAAVSNHQYYYLYTGHDVKKERQTATLDQRRKVRQNPVCVPEHAIEQTIIPFVRQFIRNWQKCCHYREGEPKWAGGH